MRTPIVFARDGLLAVLRLVLVVALYVAVAALVFGLPIGALVIIVHFTRKYW